MPQTYKIDNKDFKGLSIIGIDNGVSGAICNIENNTVTVIKTPIIKNKHRRIIDGVVAANFIKSFPLVDQIFIEAGQKNPKFGAKGNFSQGNSQGSLVTLCRLLGYTKPMLINPRQWQGFIFHHLYGVPDECRTTKDFSRRFFFEKTKTWEKDDGITDAFCIAFYGMHIQKLIK